MSISWEIPRLRFFYTPCITHQLAELKRLSIPKGLYNQFDKTKYVNDLNTVNWSEIFNNNQNLHEMTNECINTITQIID
jgi:hypothetical protein